MEWFWNLGTQLQALWQQMSAARRARQDAGGISAGSVAVELMPTTLDSDRAMQHCDGADNAAKGGELQRVSVSQPLLRCRFPPLCGPLAGVLAGGG